MGKALKSLDFFGEGIGFSIEGQGTHHSWLGALLSLFAIVVTFSYALNRADTMAKFGDTSHQTTSIETEYTKDAQLTFEESKILFAFALSNSTDFVGL